MHLINNAFTSQADPHLGAKGAMHQCLTQHGTGPRERFTSLKQVHLISALHGLFPLAPRGLHCGTERRAGRALQGEKGSVLTGR